MESPIRLRNPQPEASDLSIHDAKERCFQCLDDYTAHQNPKSAAHAQGLEQMLQLWAKHAGVDARKGMSLDDRLKDHPDLKTTFIGLLELIERRMTEALSSPHDDADPGDVPTTVTTNDDEEDDVEELLIKQKWEYYRGNIWDTISAAVDMLIKLTAMVRKASVSVRSSSLAAHFHSQDDYFAGYAKLLARNWLKDARRSLTDQLGHSVSVRRRYILYNMRHEEKISVRRTESVPAPAKTTPIPLSMREVAPKLELSKETPSPARFPRPVNPIFAGTTPSSTNLSQLDRSRLRRLTRNTTALSGITEGSVSIEETGFAYMFPEPPSLGSMQRYAPCPYCSAPLSAKDLTKHAWRKHLYEDLQPYVCISEKCQDTMQLFPTSENWLQHMEEFHGNDWPRRVHMKTWHCDKEHEREEFKSEGELRNHLVNNHTSLSDAHVGALVRRNWGIGCRDAHVCPLCESTPTNIALLTNEEDKASRLFRHIGNHLKALALFSLPSLTTDPAGDGRQPSSAARLTSDGFKADPQENKPAAAEFHDDSLEGSLDFDGVPPGHSNAGDSEAIMDKEDSSFLPPDLGAGFAWELTSSNEETHGPDPILDSLRAWHEKSQHSTEMNSSAGAMRGAEVYPLPNDKYTVGWIATLPHEAIAAKAALDDFHGRRPSTKHPSDQNSYILGRISDHNVVVASPPGSFIGTTSATTTARHMLASFSSIRIGLMVGIGAGIPKIEKDRNTNKNRDLRDIRLGDVVVSQPAGTHPGVEQYDFGKSIAGGNFQRSGFLNSPPRALLNAFSVFRQLQEGGESDMPIILNQMLENLNNATRSYEYPGPELDRLFEATYNHPEDEKTCEHCDEAKEITRPDRPTNNPRVHCGVIASGNQVIKNPAVRDRLGSDCICFETEAAGLMNDFPCLVIRGICDYADTHKNDGWQKYAAVTAAACAKEILRTMSEADIQVHSQRQTNQTILDWLTPVDYATEHNDFINMWEPGTCQWVLDSTAFQEWLSKDKHTLFCPGIPGAGKTIITAVVIQYLQSMFQGDQSIGIAYIYCNFRQQDKQKTEDLLASLLKQLSQGQPSLPESVRDLYDRHKKYRTRPSINELSSTVDSVAAAYSKIFIIVDALDECHTDQRTTEFLSRVFDLQRKSGAKFFATSRNIPNITKEFEKRQSLEMGIHASDQDVREYINNHMDRLPSFVWSRHDLQEEVESEIAKAVEGMFLLAEIYMDYLIEKTTPRALKQGLKDLRKASKSSPGGSSALYDAYDKAMDRIGRQKGELPLLAKQILSWIVKAKRTMTLQELRHALAVEVGKAELDEENLLEMEDIVSACSGLVMVDKQTLVIRLVHYTAQDYFDGWQNDWFPEAEANITKVCATYLSFRSFQSGFCRSDGEFEERLRSYPLYNYAARNWGFHARAASNLGQEVWKFLTDEKSVESAGQALMAVKRYSSGSNYSQKVVRQTSGLHLAAYFGVKEAVKTLLQQGFEADVKDSHSRTPLLWAAEYGQDAVVQLLLDLGKADVESIDNSSQTPLLWAARNGHDEVVRLLLDLGKADVEFIDDNGRTPLSWAAEYGHDEVVQLLLDLGKADVESKDYYSQTPLSWAAEYGHEAVVRLLLDLGKADVESQDEDGRTPLSCAAEYGHDTVVQLLLDLGKADVKSKDKDGRTPLSLATENGHIAVVRLLNRR